MNFKDIHIGEMIDLRVMECGVSLSRICNFLHCSEEDVQRMYKSKSLDTEILLRWSKLLEYDFFRIYSQHLILYSPPRSSNKVKSEITLPMFRKNIYTMEIIEFILEQIKSGKKTKQDIIKEYKIPKTTLYKWIEKYKN